MDESTSEEDFGRSVGSLWALHKCLALASSSSSSSSFSSSSTSNTVASNANSSDAIAAGAGGGMNDVSGAPTVGALWYWLDESVEETIIRKKVCTLRDCQHNIFSSFFFFCSFLLLFFLYNRHLMRF